MATEVVPIANVPTFVASAAATRPTNRGQTRSHGSIGRAPARRHDWATWAHVLMENRNGLVVDNRLISATGTAEREAAEQMIRGRAGAKRVTLGADKGYDTRAFVKQLRRLNVSAHIARKAVGSAMDHCVVAYTHYDISQNARSGWRRCSPG